LKLIHQFTKSPTAGPRHCHCPCLRQLVPGGVCAR